MMVLANLRAMPRHSTGIVAAMKSQHDTVSSLIVNRHSAAAERVNSLTASQLRQFLRAVCPYRLRQ
jgi:hypothetical protein